MITLIVPYIGVGERWRSLGIQGACAISDATGLTGLAVNNHYRAMVLYGTESDCKHVRTLITAAWRQAEDALRKWRKVSPEYRLVLKLHGNGHSAYYALIDGFVLGFAQGAASKIREARQAVVESTEGAELVLVSVQDRINEQLSELGESRLRAPRTSQVGFSHGYTAGLSANLVEELA